MILLKKNIIYALASLAKKLGRLIIKLYGTIIGIKYSQPNYLFKGDFNNESIIIDAGCGFDADFSVEMIKKYGLKSIGIDPTKRHAESLSQISKSYGNHFVHKQIAISSKDGKINFNESEDNVSGSILTQHNNILKDSVKNYDVESVTLRRLPKYLKLEEIEYIKLDLEGAEYELIKNLNQDDVSNYKQIFIEFHHHCTNYTKADTLMCAKKIANFGFNMFSLDNHNFLFYRK